MFSCCNLSQDSPLYMMPSIMTRNDLAAFEMEVSNLEPGTLGNVESAKAYVDLEESSSDIQKLPDMIANTRLVYPAAF